MVAKKHFVTFILIVALVDAVFIGFLTYFVSKNSSGLRHKSSIFSPLEEEAEVIINEEPEELVLNYDYGVLQEETHVDRLKQSNATDSWFSIYENLLPGKYNFADGSYFEFLKNGYFNGYFDDKNPDVSGYMYTFDNSDLQTGAIKLIVHSPDLVRDVVYDLSIDPSGYIVLQNVETGARYDLSENEYANQ